MSTTAASNVVRVPETAAANDTPDDQRGLAQTRKGRRPYMILGLVVCAVVGGYAVFHLLSAGRENTDDAQVGTDMVPID
jgi:multidrug resistance efflux pump